MSAGQAAEWRTNHAAGTRVRTPEDGGRDETASSSGHGGRRGGRDRGRIRPGRPGPDERPPRRPDRAPAARKHHRHGGRRSAAARSPAWSSRPSARPWRWRSAMAAGYFALDSLPTGEYVVQAHLNGFAGSLRERVQVGAASPAVRRFLLRKLDGPVGTAGAVTPVSARPIMAAGFGLPGSTLSDQPDSTSADAARRSSAYRNRVAPAPHQAQHPQGRQRHGHLRRRRPDRRRRRSAVRARRCGARSTRPPIFATSLFSDMPLSGEVNLLTSGAFAPGDLFAGETVPRGVAYLSLGLPTAGGDWTMRAAMSEGDLSSWNVAGAYVSKPGAAHGLNFGLTYSRQDYAGGNPAALTAVADSSRNVGEVYAFDKWAVSPHLTLEYGTRYAHYDYLQRSDLLSPRAAVCLRDPAGDTRRDLGRAADGRAWRGGVPLDQRPRSVAPARAHVRAPERRRRSGEPPRRARPDPGLRPRARSSRTRRWSACSASSSGSTIS